MTHRAVQLVALLVLTALPAEARLLAAQDTVQRSWKTLEELSTQERRDIDLATDTPRHPEVAYLPAEAYPFTPLTPRKKWATGLWNTTRVRVGRE